MEFFLCRTGLGVGGHVVQEGTPCHPARAEGLRCGRGGWRNLEKGDKLSLRTWLASEGHSQGGAGQTTVPLHPDLCAAGRGCRGMRVQGAKAGASRGGDAMCGPRTRPVARDPRLHISGGGGQKGGVEVCALSHLGQGSKGETVLRSDFTYLRRYIGLHRFSF